MRLRSALVAAAVAVLAGGALAAPASAHEEITPKTFPVGEPTFLTLTVANESADNLVKLTLQAPTGSLGSSARTPDGWASTRNASSVTWSAGTVKPGTFEIFGFELAAVDQPGPIAFKLTLEYRHANGDVETDVHQIDVAAVAPGAAPPGPAPAVSSSTTASTAPAAAPSGNEDDESRGGDSEETPAAAKAALAIAIVSLLVSAAALVLAGRRRGGPGGATGVQGSGAAQDW